MARQEGRDCQTAPVLASGMLYMAEALTWVLGRRWGANRQAGCRGAVGRQEGRDEAASLRSPELTWVGGEGQKSGLH